MRFPKKCRRTARRNHRPAVAGGAVRLALFLPAALIATFIVPAYHVLWSTYWPIEPFYVEYGKLRNPPNLFQATRHLQNARRLREERRIDAAIAELNEALKFESNFALALIERAVLRTQTGDLSVPSPIAARPCGCSPIIPTRSCCAAPCSLRGEKGEAAADFRQMLALSPTNWEFREEAERRLAEVMQ